MTICLGILGLGSTGRHHVRNVRVTEGAELVALADLAGDRFSVAPPLEVLPDVEDLIAARIDAAIMAVPTTFHEETALLPAEARVHTLVEKPLLASVEPGRRIAEAFERADLVDAVRYVGRRNPAPVEMHRRIAQDQLGGVYRIVTRRRSFFPACTSDAGVVKDLTTHDADLAPWVVSAPYKTMFAQTGCRSEQIHEDLSLASGCFTNGVLVDHQVGWLTPYKDHTTIVIGEHGALVTDTAMGDLNLYKNGSSPLQWEQTAASRGVLEGTAIRYALDKCEPFAVEHEHFRDAIPGQDGGYMSMTEGVRALEILEDVLESTRMGQVIRFNE